MPLIKGSSKETRQKNIDELIRSGRDPKQAVAIAYANQRKYKKMAEGGEIQGERAEADIADLPMRSQEELQIESTPLGEEFSEIPQSDKALAQSLQGQMEEIEHKNEQPQTPATKTSDSGLSDEAKRAILAKKARRVFKP